MIAQIALSAQPTGSQSSLASVQDIGSADEDTFSKHRLPLQLLAEVADANRDQWPAVAARLHEKLANWLLDRCGALTTALHKMAASIDR